MMRTYKNTAMTAIALAMLAVLNGCSGEAEEAKKLGFASVEEMKEIHAKGWHTKDQYLKDATNSDKTAVSNKHLNEEKAAVPQSPANEVATQNVKDNPASNKGAVGTTQDLAIEVAGKWDNDEFVECYFFSKEMLEFRKSSSRSNESDIKEAEKRLGLFAKVLDLKRQGGQLSQQQFETKYQVLAQKGDVKKDERLGKFISTSFSTCNKNARTVTDVLDSGYGYSAAKIESKADSMQSPEQLASKIPPMDAARCGIVFSSYGAIMFNSNQTDEALAGMRFTQATQYVVNQAVSRGEPSQLFENAEKAYSQEMRVTPPNNIVNEATACAKVFRPLFLALDARGHIKR